MPLNTSHPKFGLKQALFEVLHPVNLILHASSVVNTPSAHYHYLQAAVVEFHVHLKDNSSELADSQTDLIYMMNLVLELYNQFH